MYHKILVTYDGSGAGDAALREGLELARMASAELHVLGIVVSPAGLALDPAVASAERLECERSCLHQALTDAVRGLGAQGADARACLRDEDAAGEIVDYAEMIRADLAVMGRGGNGLLARWCDTSVGAWLLETIPCRLLVAGDGASPAARHWGGRA